MSVTDRCNYGCSYCIPDDGVEHADRADVLSFEEIAALVRVFVSLGVRRVRLTGGEPTVRRDLPALVRLLRAIPGLEEIALSSNGHLLAELAAPLRAAGVDRLNISLDSLDAERFRRITRRGDLARVLAGIEAARAAGFASIKLNTVAIRGFNDDEFDRICAWAWERGLVPRFIEEMPMADGRAYLPGALLAAAEIRASHRRRLAGNEAVADDAERRARRRPGPLLPPRARRARGARAPLRHHLADDRALLHHLQPAAAVDGGRAARLPRSRRRRRSARAAARGRRRRGRAGDPGRARRQAGRAHVPADRARRTAQGDGTNRRMIDGARLKQRIAELAPAFEERLAALCGIPTVSMDPGRRAEMGACAKLGAELLREAGAHVDVDRHRRLPAGARPLHPGPVVPDGDRVQPPRRAAGRRRRIGTRRRSS